MKNEKSFPSDKTGLKMSLDRLRGRQSVRTTFRLPEDVIGLLGMAADQFELQQKVLLDQLIDNNEVLQRVAEKVMRESRSVMAGRPKTFVLSKRSLFLLEKVSRQYKVPRDALVEAAILRIVPVIRSEQEKQKKRMEIVDDIVSYLRQGQKLLDKSESLLGQGDYVHEMIARMIRLCEGNVQKMNERVVKGQDLEAVEVDNY